MKRLKRIFQLWVLGLFLAFTIGIPLHKHYCGEKLFSAGIISKDCCCEDTETNPDDCCKTETSVYSIDDHYDITKTGKVKIQAPELFVPKPLEFKRSAITPVNLTQNSIEPPEEPLGKTPLYKLLQEFTFYS